MKKFDWKKLLVLVLVLALCVTMFAACKDDPGSDPIDDGGKDAPESNIKPQAKKVHFFDTMFKSADKIGQNTVTVTDDAVYIKLGVGLDLAIGGNDITSQSAEALNLDIIVEAVVDTKEVELKQHKDGKYLENGNPIANDTPEDAKYRYEPKATNTSAAKVVIKAGSVELISAYYDMSDESGIFYAVLGGNKVAIDISDVPADIQNVEAIVVDAIIGVINNKVVGNLVGTFGEDFTLNGFLNELLAGLGLDLAGLIKDNATVSGIVQGVLGVDDIGEFFDDNGGLLLGDVLAAAGPLLFKTPVWKDANGTVITSTTALPAVAGVACTGEIGLDLMSESLAAITGSIDLIANATLALGFTKTAADKMDSFYIDAKINKLGANEDRALALRISIEDLVINNEDSTFTRLSATEKAAYKTPAFDIDLEIALPDKVVELALAEDSSLLVPNANPAEGEFEIPAYFGLEIQGKFDFCHAENTAAKIVLKVGKDKDTAVAGAQAQLYYDSTNGYGVAEVEVLEAGQGTYSTVKALIYQFAKLQKWGWYNPDGTDIPTYENVNTALTAFQQTGKLRCTGIDVYKLIWPGDGNGIFTYDNTPATAAAAPLAEASLDFMSTKTGLIAIIAQLVNIDITNNKISIGCDNTMKYLFTDNLFTIKDEKTVTLADLCAIWSLNDAWIAKNSQSFYQEDGVTLIDGISIKEDSDGNSYFFATKPVRNANANNADVKIKWGSKTDGQGYKVWIKSANEVDLSVAAECWNEVLNSINAVIGEGGAVKELTVDDIENADANIDLTWKDANGVLSEIALEVKVVYPNVTTPITVKLTAQMKAPDFTTFGNTSYFTAEEDYGQIDLTIRNKTTGEQVYPAVAA